MAKFRSIIYFNGRAGNIVGRKGKDGSYIVAQYQPDVHDPHTQAQLEQRKKISVMMKALGPIAPWAKKMIHVSGRTAWNELMKLNINEAVGGTYPNYEPAWNNLVVSEGNLSLPYNPSGSLDSNTLSLSWSDNSGTGFAYSDDNVAVLVVNSTKQTAIYDITAATRSERAATMNIPTAWNGDSVEVYLAMKVGTTGAKEAGSNAASKSFYIGSFTV